MVAGGGSGVAPDTSINVNYDISGHEIYDQMRNDVNGTGSLHDATRAASNGKASLSNAEQSMRMYQTAIAAGIQGGSGDAAHQAAQPVLSGLMKSQEELTDFGNMTNAQGDSFDRHAHSLVKVPKDKPDFWSRMGSSINPFATDDPHNDMAKYNKADHHNKITFKRYGGLTQQYAGGLPGEQQPKINTFDNIEIYDPKRSPGHVYSGGGDTGSGSGGGGSYGGPGSGGPGSGGPGGGGTGGTGTGGPDHGGIGGTGGGTGSGGPGGGYPGAPGTYQPVPASTTAAGYTASGVPGGYAAGGGFGGSGSGGYSSGGFGPGGSAGGIGGGMPMGGGFGAGGGFGSDAAASGRGAGAGGMQGGGRTGAGALGAAGEQGAVGGRAGAAGASGRQGVGGMPMGGRGGKGGDDEEHQLAGYLVNEDNGSEIVGDVPLTAPPVIGE